MNFYEYQPYCLRFLMQLFANFAFQKYFDEDLFLYHVGVFLLSCFLQR